MERLSHAHAHGGWVLLQNIHLTIDWTSGPLEKRVDKLAEGAHPDFRLFLSAEPPPALERPLPISILQARRAVGAGQAHDGEGKGCTAAVVARSAAVLATTNHCAPLSPCPHACRRPSC